MNITTYTIRQQLAGGRLLEVRWILVIAICIVRRHVVGGRFRMEPLILAIMIYMIHQREVGGRLQEEQWTLVIAICIIRQVVVGGRF